VIVLGGRRVCKTRDTGSSPDLASAPSIVELPQVDVGCPVVTHIHDAPGSTPGPATDGVSRSRTVVAFCYRPTCTSRCDSGGYFWSGLSGLRVQVPRFCCYPDLGRATNSTSPAHLPVRRSTPTSNCEFDPSARTPFDLGSATTSDAVPGAQATGASTRDREVASSTLAVPPCAGCSSAAERLRSRSRFELGHPQSG
jgi:hypothetical protein